MFRICTLTTTKKSCNPAHSSEWVSKKNNFVSNHLMFNNDLSMLLFPLQAYILIKLQILGFYAKFNGLYCTEIFTYIISWKGSFEIRCDFIKKLYNPVFLWKKKQSKFFYGKKK